MGKEERFEIDPLPPDTEAEEESPLVARLRRLKRPTVDPEVRQRSWERFQQLLADADRSSEDPEDDRQL